jgi:hypothetical protein
MQRSWQDVLLRSNTHSSPNGGKKIVQAKAAPLEVGKPYRPHLQTPTPQNVLWWEMRQGLPSEIRDFYDTQSQGAISVLIG